MEVASLGGDVSDYLPRSVHRHLLEQGLLGHG